MPQSTPTNIPRGPGSENPEWNAPNVGVATPGLNVQDVQPTKYQQLRDAMLTLGQGVASGLSAAAQIKNNFDRLKETSMNEIDRDLRAANMSIQAQRLMSQKREFLDLQVQAEERGPAWLADQAKARLSNAASLEEQQLWTGVYVSSNNAAQQEAAQAGRDSDLRVRQDYARAGRTAHNVVIQLGQELQLNPDLQAELIGNGKGIHERVQNWILAEAAAASPEAFIFGKNDPLFAQRKEEREMLTAQLVGQSMNIADFLVNKVVKDREQGNLVHGVEQVDSDIFDYLTKDGDLNHLTNSASAVFDEQFAHLTEAEKTDTWKKRAADTLVAAATGQFGGSMKDMLDRASAVLGMKINGNAVFTPVEQATIGMSLLDTARKTATSQFDAEVGRLVQGQTTAVMSGDGVVSFIPDPLATQNLSKIQSNGLSQIDNAANRVLSNMGLLDKAPDQLTQKEAMIVGSVREAAGQMQAKSQRDLMKRSAQISNFNLTMMGDPAGDPKDAYLFAPSTRVMSTSGGLTAEEASAMKQAVYDTARSMFGQIPTELLRWDGATPPPRVPETRTLRKVLATHEAAQWSLPQQAEQFGIPEQLVKDKLALFASGDIEKFHDAVQFASALGSERRLEDLINGFNKEGGTQTGAALYYAVQAQQGTLGGDIKPDLKTVQQQVSAILEAGPLDDFLKKQSPFSSEPNDTNQRVIAASVINAINAVQPGEFDLQSPDAKMRTEQVEGILTSAFSEGNTMVRTIQRMGQALMASHPAADANTIGGMILSHLDSLGINMVLQNGRPVGIPDPHKHAGQHLVDLNTKVQDQSVVPYNVETRQLIAQAMGYPLADIPVSLADWYQKEYPDIFVNYPREQMRWSTEGGLTTAGVDTLLRPASALGGITVQAKLPGREDILPPILSRVAISVTQPDGTVIDLPAGTPISTFSMHFQPAQWFQHSQRPAPQYTGDLTGMMLMP